MAESSAGLVTLHAIVHGWVQGVFFRATTADRARQIGLTGWVRNRYDGTVEAVATGTRSALEEFVVWLRQGPPGARVTQVELVWQTAVEPFDDFDIRYTD